MHVIHFDETNVVMRREEGKSYLDKILAAIRGVNRDSKLGFLYCILSGTNARSLHDLLQTATCAAPLEVSLPLLEAHHVREVLCDLVERGSKEKSLGRDLDFVIDVLDGVPRYVEMLVFALGLEVDGKFQQSLFAKRLKAGEHSARVLLEAVKSGITIQYGSTFALMLTGLKVFGLVASSLFQWQVSRDSIFGGRTVGELESQGILFVQGSEPQAVIKLPLILLLFLSQGAANTPMLLKHFDVMLSPDENERASMAILALKCAGLAEMGREITAEVLFGTLGTRKGLVEKMMTTALTFKTFEVQVAQSQITVSTWAKFLEVLKKTGGFILNAPKAPFADGGLVPQRAEMVILVQEKQGEVAKRQNQKKRKVHELSIANVRAEHAKCNVKTPHLFVLVTDEDFTDHNELAENEIVVSHRDHAAVIGPLLALLRLFNHSHVRKLDFMGK
jgi:hypothetical protein